MKILIAGAGIVGVSTAIWCQRAGHDVTLIDAKGPAQGTSHGNAGVLAAGGVMPVTTPGLAFKAPRMLLDPDAPLFLRWRYLPRLLPFLARYLSHATDAHVDHYAQAMSTLLADSHDQHAALSAGTPAAQYLHDDDYFYGYATHAAFEQDAYGWAKRVAAGVAYDVLRGTEYAAIDPIFGDAFETVVRCRNHGRISDPGAYVRALADHFVDQGGSIDIATVQDIDVRDGQVTGVMTDQGHRSADKIVLAMGAWSKGLACQLGLDVPMESERGYHIELINPSFMPRAPMMVAAGKFVLTPMEGRLRAAGVVEFGGLHAGPSRAPIALLRRQVAALLPDITYDRIDEWMGHRPAPADSLPLIGAADAYSRAYVAFGHQHVGLTGGAKTGRIIADMLDGRAPNLDLAPFDPKRYAS